MEFLNILIKGFSQVFFQDNLITGIIFIIGLGIASPRALFLALIGNIVSTLTSSIIGPNKILMELGVYGLNGVLIGSALALYIKDPPLSVAAVIIGSITAAILFMLIEKMNIPPLSLPFAIVTVIIILLTKYYKIT